MVWGIGEYLLQILSMTVVVAGPVSMLLCLALCMYSPFEKLLNVILSV